MAEDDKKSFWSSLPGVLTGLAAILTAAGGLIYHNQSHPRRSLRRCGKNPPARGHAPSLLRTSSRRPKGSRNKRPIAEIAPARLPGALASLSRWLPVASAGCGYETAQRSQRLGKPSSGRSLWQARQLPAYSRHSLREDSCKVSRLFWTHFSGFFSSRQNSNPTGGADGMNLISGTRLDKGDSHDIVQPAAMKPTIGESERLLGGEYARVEL